MPQVPSEAVPEKGVGIPGADCSDGVGDVPDMIGEGRGTGMPVVREHFLSFEMELTSASSMAREDDRHRLC